MGEQKKTFFGKNINPIDFPQTYARFTIHTPRYIQQVTY